MVFDYMASTVATMYLYILKKIMKLKHKLWDHRKNTELSVLPIRPPEIRINVSNASVFSFVNSGKIGLVL